MKHTLCIERNGEYIRLTEKDFEELNTLVGMVVCNKIADLALEGVDETTLMVATGIGAYATQLIRGALFHTDKFIEMAKNVCDVEEELLEEEVWA